MASTITIELKKLRFFAYHGLYAEERKTGNEFEINLSVSFLSDEKIITQLSHSIDYVSIHALLKEEMEKPRHLLETFITELAQMIHKKFPGVNKVDISLTKLHVPIEQSTGQISVSLSKKFKK